MGNLPFSALELARLQGLPQRSPEPPAITHQQQSQQQGTQPRARGVKGQRWEPGWHTSGSWTGTSLGRGAPASTCPSTLSAVPTPCSRLARLSRQREGLGCGHSWKKGNLCMMTVSQATWTEEQSDQLPGERACGRGLPWPAKPRDGNQLLK